MYGMPLKVYYLHKIKRINMHNGTSCVCTITTLSHMPQTLALRNSVLKNNKETVFCILIVDSSGKENFKPAERTRIFTLPDIKGAYLSEKIIKKYGNYKKDKLRWSLKPVFMNFLLNDQNMDRVLFCDNDMFFFNDFSFLFKELDSKRFLLCPHWRVSHSSKGTAWFIVNFTDGFYNAGLIAARKDATEILKWWADACLFKCDKLLRKGLFVDQKYLDFVPVIFEGVGIISHRGCNVAYWNQEENKRISVGDVLKINGHWPIVCVHFTKELIKSIKSKKDPLQTYLTAYLETINNCKNL